MDGFVRTSGGGEQPVLTGGGRQLGEPGAERNHVGFQSAYLVLAAGVGGSFLTGDLFNLFVSFEMLLFAVILTALIGVPFGVISAIKRNSLIDYAIRGMPTTVFISADGKLLERAERALSESQLEAIIERLFAIS